MSIRGLTVLILLSSACEGLIGDGGADEGYADCIRRPNHPRCNAAPAITITSPASGTSVSGTVELTGTASDDRAVARVEVAVDGGSAAVASGTTSWSFTLDTAGLSDATHTVTARAVDDAGKSTATSISLVVASGGSQPSAGYGPQAEITCPAGAVNIAPDQDVPAIVDSHPAGTSFCVLAGTHFPGRPINLKAGMKLVGQFGAVLDGSNMAPMPFDVGSTSIVRGWNCGGDCSGATVKNLVIRDQPEFTCIGNASAGSENWIIEHNDVSGCRWGINLVSTSGTRVSHNYIHHNDTQASSGGWAGIYTRDVVWSDNENAFNGSDNKVHITTNVTFRNNWSHDNVNVGIWMDGDNTGALIEGNLVEDNGGAGIFYEISGPGIIRNNTIARSGGNGLFLSNSRDVEISGNTLIDNFRGLSLFLNCDFADLPPNTPYEGAIGWDLRNLSLHDNTVVVGGQTDPFAATLTSGGNCAAGQLDPYVNGSKNIVFQGNHYFVPSLSTRYWIWGNVLMLFGAWQAAGSDTAGSVQLGRP